MTCIIFIAQRCFIYIVEPQCLNGADIMDFTCEISFLRAIVGDNTRTIQMSLVCLK